MSALSKPSGKPTAPVIDAGPLATRPRGAVSGFSLALSILSCLMLVGLLGWLMLFVPKFEKIYVSFNATLPRATIWVLRASAFVCSWWMLVLPAAVAAMAGLICLSVFGRGRIRAAVAVVALMLVGGIGLLAAVAIWMPLPRLVEAAQR